MTKKIKQIYCDSCGKVVAADADSKEMRTKYGSRFFHDPPEACAKA